MDHGGKLLLCMRLLCYLTADPSCCAGSCLRDPAVSACALPYRCFSFNMTHCIVLCHFRCWRCISASATRCLGWGAWAPLQTNNTPVCLFLYLFACLAFSRQFHHDKHHAAYVGNANKVKLIGFQERHSATGITPSSSYSTSLDASGVCSACFFLACCVSRAWT